MVKSIFFALSALYLMFLSGCVEEDLGIGQNQTTSYAVSFDPSPGRFLLENNGNTIVANGVNLDISVQVNYNETAEIGVKPAPFITTLTETIKTDSSGKMILNIHPKDEYQQSRENFNLSSSQYTSGGKKILISRINSINVIIKTIKNGVTYQKEISADASTYYWDYIEGFFPIFGSDLPEIETRSTATLPYYGKFVKYWYIKLISDITLYKI